MGKELSHSAVSTRRCPVRNSITLGWHTPLADALHLSQTTQCKASMATNRCPLLSLCSVDFLWTSLDCVTGTTLADHRWRPFWVTCLQVQLPARAYLISPVSLRMRTRPGHQDLTKYNGSSRTDPQLKSHICQLKATEKESTTSAKICVTHLLLLYIFLLFWIPTHNLVLLSLTPKNSAPDHKLNYTS